MMVYGHFDKRRLVLLCLTTYHPSLSWALTSQPSSTRKRTISKWPAQMALCKAVMPSSLAALGFVTWEKRKTKKEAKEWTADRHKQTNNRWYELFVDFLSLYTHTYLKGCLLDEFQFTLERRIQQESQRIETDSTRLAESVRDAAL